METLNFVAANRVGCHRWSQKQTLHCMMMRVGDGTWSDGRLREWVQKECHAAFPQQASALDVRSSYCQLYRCGTVFYEDRRAVQTFAIHVF